MKKMIFIIFLFLAGCDTGQPAANSRTTPVDTVKQILSTSAQSGGATSSYTRVKNKRELFGVWASDNKESLTAEINKDSIYYTEHFESYKYSFKGDSIFISYPDFIFSAKVYFTQDTLIMESEDGQSRYYRFKE